MTILVSGGGTGGHVTPILAVAHELKRLHPDCRIVYVGEHNGKFQSLVDNHSAIDEIITIRVGKFRRYHGDSLLRRMLDIKTLFLNARDGLYVVIGILQSLRIISKTKPDVVFLKGGFVGVPVGLAAAVKHVPFITHDSDALPGLANRLVGRWASLHATGMPTEFYPYSKHKTRYVGVVVSTEYQPVNEAQQNAYKHELNIPEGALCLLVTGGSLGARRLNESVAALALDLLEAVPNLHIIHQVGRGNMDQVSKIDHPRYSKLEFMDGMHRYTGAADLVITRAGANTLAELGVQGKACIVVPNYQLTGGHQIKNAAYLAQHHAIEVVDENILAKDVSVLRKPVEQLLQYPMMRLKLAQTLQGLTKRSAAQELATLITEMASRK